MTTSTVTEPTQAEAARHRNEPTPAPTGKWSFKGQAVGSEPSFRLGKLELFHCLAELKLARYGDRGHPQWPSSDFEERYTPRLIAAVKAAFDADGDITRYRTIGRQLEEAQATVSLLQLKVDELLVRRKMLLVNPPKTGLAEALLELDGNVTSTREQLAEATRLLVALQDGIRESREQARTAAQVAIEQARKSIRAEMDQRLAAIRQEIAARVGDLLDEACLLTANGHSMRQRMPGLAVEMINELLSEEVTPPV